MLWFGMRGGRLSSSGLWAGVFLWIAVSSGFAQLGQPLDEEAFPDPPPRLNPAADPQEAEMDREDNRQQALNLLQAGQGVAQQQVLSGEPRLVLDGVLQFLELDRQGIAAEVSQLEALQHFAELAWERKPKESRRQMLLRLMAPDPGDARADQEDFPNRMAGLAQREASQQLASQYQEMIGQGWPLEWRPRQVDWAAFLEVVLEGHHVENPVEYWKRKIAADPAQAETYRVAYLANSRAKRDSEIDLELLAPWLDEQGPVTPRRLQRLAELFNTVQLLSLSPDDPLRRDFRDRLVKALSATDLGAESFDSPMGHAVRSVVAASDPDARLIRQEILNRQPPRVFLRLMAAGHEDSSTISSAFFGKRVKCNWRGVALEKGVEELLQQVAAPIWVDKSLRGKTAPISMTFEGPWLAALDKALEGTDCEARFLPRQVLWIGAKSQRKAAEAMYRDALARLNHFGELLEQPPADLSGLAAAPPKPFDEFVQAWNEGEYADVQLRLLDRSLKQRMIAAPSPLLPVALRLALIAENADVDWQVDSIHVIFASKARIAQLDERANRLQRRLVPLADRTDRVATALREPSQVDYEGILPEALRIIGQNEPLPVLYLADSRQAPSPDSEASIHADREPLAHGLDLLTVELNLDWAEDEQALYLGTPAGLATLPKRAALRRNRPVPSADDAARLRKPINSVRSDRELSHLAGQIAAMLKRDLDLSAVPDEVKRRTFHLFAHQVPLEVVVDTLAAQCGLRWEMDGAKLKFLPADRGP